MADDLEVFHPTLTFSTRAQRWRNNHAWPFQRDYLMRNIIDTQHRACSRWLFVVKKYILIYFFKWPIVSLDQTLIPRLGSCRALWSCIETVIWTFNPLCPIEVHSMEKNPRMFSSKSLISVWLKKERHDNLEWHGIEMIRKCLIWKWTNLLNQQDKCVRSNII